MPSVLFLSEILFAGCSRSQLLSAAEEGFPPRFRNGIIRHGILASPAMDTTSTGSAQAPTGP